MLVINKFEDRYSIVDLQTKAVEEVVDNDHVLEVTVLDDSEILDEEAILGLHAMLPGEYIWDVLVLRIDVIDDGICIVLGGGCEDDDLVGLAHVLEELHQVGS